MKFTKTQYKKLEGLMPIARKLAKILNCEFMCAMLYITENGCKWRTLPKKYGNWHIVYMKFSRWPKNGTIAKSYCFFFFKTLTKHRMFKRWSGNQVVPMLHIFMSSGLSFISWQFSQCSRRKKAA